MCDQCTKFDLRIAHYREITTRITDQKTLDGITGLIREMTAAKVALHPELKEK